MAAERTMDGAGLDSQAALVASGHAFAVCDARAPDWPLVWVNPAFERLTGYVLADVEGRNCRLLQGPATESGSTSRIRSALSAGQSVTETLMNYRKDGSAWWNQVTITPVHDDDGVLTHFVGVQSDVTDRIRAGEQRDAARVVADAAGARLTLLAEAGEMLATTLDPAEAVSKLMGLLLPTVADWCSVMLTSAMGPPDFRPRRSVTMAHHDPQLADVVERLSDDGRGGTADGAVQAQVLRTRRPMLITDVTEDYLADTVPDAQLPDWLAMGLRSLVVVPLLGRDEPIGCLTLALSDSLRTFTSSDVEFVTDLGLRAGAALETMRLYAAEHSAALALQNSLLPTLPRVEGLELAARYIPGSAGAEVGGDWYDVLQLPDGSTGVAVGDVMGHDMHAAAAMGQLRSVLRSYAWEGHSPAGVLDRLNQLVRGLGMGKLATCIYARIEPAVHQPAVQNPAGHNPAVHRAPAVLHWSNAGHPPPLLKTPDGVVHVLTEAASPLIGVGIGHSALLDRPGATRPVPKGCVLLIYTDGLIENRHRDIDEGIDLLRVALTESAADIALEDLADRLITVAGSSDENDDQCLLLVRLC